MKFQSFKPLIGLHITLHNKTLHISRIKHSFAKKRGKKLRFSTTFLSMDNYTETIYGYITRVWQLTSSADPTVLVAITLVKFSDSSSDSCNSKQISCEDGDDDDDAEWKEAR